MRARRSVCLAILAVALPTLVGIAARSSTNSPRFSTRGLGVSPAYGEPSIAVAKNGKNIAISTPGSDDNCKTAASSTVQIWWSANDGASFNHSCYASPNGGGDSEVDFLPNGNLLSADLEITDSYIQISTNGGKTWTPVGTAGTEQDRQWLAHTPDGKTAYLVYHDFVAEAELFAKSTDGGKTWDPSQCCNVAQSPDQITAPGIATTPRSGSPAPLLDQEANTFSGPMLIDPKNPRNLYVVYSISNFESNADPRAGVPPYGPPRGIVILHSGDAGASWESHYAAVSAPKTDPTTEDNTGVLFPWGTIDRAGNLYVVYNASTAAGGDHYRQYYVWSSNQGKTWSKPIRLDNLRSGTGSAVYATAEAGAPGVLDVAWYQTKNGAPSDDASLWNVEFTQVRGANTPRPQITTPVQVGAPNHKGGICLQGILCGVGPGSGDRSLLDFFQVAINPVTGMAEIAYAANVGLGTDKSTGVVTGNVLMESSPKGQVMFARQIGGRSAL
jgi:hypothetical protein